MTKPSLQNLNRPQLIKLKFWNSEMNHTSYHQLKAKPRLTIKIFSLTENLQVLTELIKLVPGIGLL